MSTCDDHRVPKPATGKTPVRNARIPDDVWLPALAKAEMEGKNASEAMTDALRSYAAEADAPAYGFTFANWPQAEAWAQERRTAIGHLVSDLAGVFVILPADWLAIAAWLPATHHEGDPTQQVRVLTGHILRYLTASGPDDPWRGKYRDSRHLSETVQAILRGHIPLGEL